MLLFIGAKAQVSTDPTYPIASSGVTVYFDATGTGLDGYTGDVYAHTGVTVDGDQWQYVIGQWGDNSAQPKLTRISTNHYKLDISPSIYDFYGVPTSKTISQMCFVFRSADGSSQTSDIFVTVYGKKVSFDSPDTNKIYSIGDSVDVSAVSVFADSIKLYVADTLYKKIAGKNLDTKVAAKTAGRIKLKAIAFNTTDTTTSESSFFVRETKPTVTLPSGLEDGINYINNDSVVLVLYAPKKKYVFVKGDFNNWSIMPEYQMNLTPDSTRFWLGIGHLTSGKEYAYQYYVDGQFSIADPYTEKILDPWNDKYISSSTYPNLKAYPKGAQGIVSVFQTDQQPYNWQVTNFKRPDKKKLVIYELLVRDFSSQSNYQAIIDSLDYLKRLGINAIELMPIMEFEGNISWGYNPDFYFAPDKYYGTKNKLKELIDVCHKNGIAVILDVVFNHSMGQSPLVQLYFDRKTGKVTPDNPWYNVSSPNTAYSWGYDFNHESPDTRRFVDRALAFWLKEYHIDGYRFDFAKGFTNTAGDGTAYDASRISILKQYADTIWKTSPGAYVILEYFVDNSEEKVMSDYGTMTWGNLNYAYSQSSMGYSDGSDFSWISYKNRGFNNASVVGYMESHDEERLMYKNLTWGNASGGYSVKDLTTALNRIKEVSVFFLTVPGPKMLWQFEELGYDYSIDYCEDGSINTDCRTHPKPVRWDYYTKQRRRNLYNFWSNLIHLRNKLGVFSTNDFSMNTSGIVKQIILRGNDTDVVIIGNFDVVEHSASPAFPHSGTWYDYFSGTQINASKATIELKPGEYRMYFDVDMGHYTGIRNKCDKIGDDVMVFPNPTNNFLIFDNLNVGDRVVVSDILGKEVDSFDVRNIGEIRRDYSKLSNGIYFVEIITKKGDKKLKFVKE